MPELRALYIVTGVVFMGLVIWVVSVLSRRDNKLVPPRAREEEPPPPRSETSPPTERPLVDLPPVRERLSSHQEIQDEPPSVDKKDG
jgi:hypothetical protein